MKLIQTVAGTLSLDQLGYCQMHEHLYVSEGPATHKNPALLIDDPIRSTLELSAYCQAGGRSILDAQPVGAGRNATILREMSLRTGIHIITVTGFHLPHFYAPDHWVLNADRQALTERFTRELLEGCEEASDIRAGAVKAAIGRDGLQDATRDRFFAAATAAARANVPLVVHTEKGFDAVRAVQSALDLGVPAHKILICHADRQAEDFAPHDVIANTGAMLEYDTIGRFKYHDDASEIRLIQHMLDRGHAAQLLFSLDTTRERLGSYGGTIRLTYLLEDFLLKLLNAGISKEIFQSIMIDNPKGVFE